jgi:hypothetical protein
VNRPVAASCRVGLLAAIGALSSSCQHTPTAAPARQVTAADFRASIAALENADPNSPSALEAHLGFADFLVEQDRGPCAQRLDQAQSQVQAVAANPAAEVVFPGGWARVAELQYRIHRGRAACTADPLVRTQELQSAIKAAQRAVQSFRDEFDYPSMAVSQFDVAATYHAAADDTNAIAALRAAIAMDREFGLRSDAQDNYGLLLSWNSEPAGPEQVAQRMADFPSRSVTLRFAWSPGDAQVTINTTHARLVKGAVVDARSARGFVRRIRAAGDDWVVSDAGTEGPIDFGVWPRETEHDLGPVAVFRPTLPRFPTIELTQTGDFKGVNDLEGFATQINAAAQQAIRARAPPGVFTAQLLRAALRDSEVDFDPGVIEDQAQQSYELETAMWIGATLEQGVAYELIAPLSLPGAPQIILYHRLRFSFTREVPCPGRAERPTCVELIVHASPQEEPLEEVMGSLHLEHGETMRYLSATTVRIVTDPQTLRPYLNEVRRYWYVTLGKRIPRETLMESDHNVMASSYP